MLRRRAESADSCELKSFLQRDSDLRARWAPGRLAWQEHQGWLKQASCLFLSQDTFVQCYHVDSSTSFSSGITSHLLPFLISLGCRQRWLSRKMGSPLCQCFPPAPKFIYPFHITAGPDLTFTTSQPPPPDLTPPTRFTFLFFFLSVNTLSSVPCCEWSCYDPLTVNVLEDDSVDQSPHCAWGHVGWPWWEAHTCCNSVLLLGTQWSHIKPKSL